MTYLGSQAHRRDKIQTETARPANTRDNQMNPVLPPQQALDTLTHLKYKILT
ncbi:hypothetical protein T4D_2408 [Trichinella pseudospiralis]|uniref:Uncharacterized protein n=1 Tax=Trichinella pseudospiralis TaxID=6337 RepID=A0A0V1DMU4_TRIPS|nr:hypothetical protein T4D_2408 [Trichinella pseudospiralis]